MYLDWRSYPIKIQIENSLLHNTRDSTRVSIGFCKREIESLHFYLEKLFGDGLGSEKREMEIKHLFPLGWTFFWKKKEDKGAFSFLAHPEINQWVGTLGFDLNFGRSWLHCLRKLSHYKEAFSIEQIGKVTPVSNLDLRFYYKGV
jgi:hypothetical protein